MGGVVNPKKPPEIGQTACRGIVGICAIFLQHPNESHEAAPNKKEPQRLSKYYFYFF